MRVVFRIECHRSEAPTECIRYLVQTLAGVLAYSSLLTLALSFFIPNNHTTRNTGSGIAAQIVGQS